VTDLILLAPELILVGAALTLILTARHVRRAQPAAVVALVAAVGAAGFGVTVPLQEFAVAFEGIIVRDGYARFFNVVFTANLALVTLLSVRHLNAERVRPAEYHALLLLATTGMMLAGSAVDVLILYLGLELMTLCSYFLVGITRDNPMSNEAAIKYFLLGSFASAVLLYGIALVYGATGATDFAAISAAVSLGQSPLLLAGVALVIGGLGFKIAAAPFHAWAPDAYQGASPPVAAFLAAGFKAAGLAALVRLCLSGFGPEPGMWRGILVALAVLSMTIGSLLAVSQSDMKRLLAYSSIAHAGYALLGLIAGTPEGASATMIYAFIYAFMTLGAFGVLIGLGERAEQLTGFQGLAKTDPRASGFMFLFLLSLTGIPPTAGFAAKFAVILAAVRAGYVALAVVAVLCSVVSAYFYMRVAVLMYMRDPEGEPPQRFPIAVLAALAVAALVTVAGGIFPGGFDGWAAGP